ncbi:adenosylcobinamide-GDP ribazoletransferase [Curvibacter sp. RS43]|uniref:adenosylcobinamide-GDP ribazoletransferase n=1 Tax=Curvibacter microcysteis TaxID=3026419 RepID=UPI00235DE803|nr:adenosylcobinamide-GDP ribazoletransferase [Curvibacter sp. RS43]MDD0811494.1 adenosylcobinamide-GDP ribazoletransferase [Curvibacter sp. RS43]
MNFVRHVLLAVQFFTRIPITGRLADWVGYSPAMLRASAAHFPAIGWLAGGLAAGVFWALSQALGPSPWSAAVAAVACTVATVMMTGGFHEDGLADVADGLGGSYDRERALDIMKDSRVGAFGAMALQLGLLSKIAVLAWLGQASLPLAISALLLGHVLSRLWPLWLVRTLPHVGDTARSKSKPLADQISGPALGAAVLWCLPPLLLLAWQLGPSLVGAGVLAGALALAYMGRLFRRRLQGFTGDCLGATQQVCEIATYLGLAIAWAQQSAA